MSAVLIAGPTLEPVTLQEAKDHLRVDGTTEDALIAALITAARRAGEGWTRRAWLGQTWRLFLDAFPPARDPARAITDVIAPASFREDRPRAIELPMPPLQSVTSLVIYDDADAPTTVDAASYFVDSANAPGRIVPRKGQTWPSSGRSANAVEITFIAGYGAMASDVPAELRQGLLMLLAHLYEQREAVTLAARSAVALPLGVRALWQPYRVVGL